MNNRVILFYVHCRRWVSRRKAAGVHETPECPLCGSRMIAALKPWGDKEIMIMQKGWETEKERAKRVYKNANLVLSHEETRSSRLQPAGSVLIPRRGSSASVWWASIGSYADIFQAERNYVQTLQFWD